MQHCPDATKVNPAVKRLSPKQVKDITLKNKARQAAGLNILRIKVRKCIWCGRFFESAENITCGCMSRLEE